MFRRALAGSAALSLIFLASTSHAHKFYVGGAHAAYSLGGATGPYSGFRQNIDLALFPLMLVTNKSRYIETYSGLTAGGSLMMGIGNSPSYASFEVGPAFSSFAGGIATLGPVWRQREVKFEGGTGGQLRVSVDVFLLEVGFRVLTIFSGRGETQATFSIGIGRF